MAQIRKLKQIATERGYRLVPGHDPDAWPALTAELARARAGPGDLGRPGLTLTPGSDAGARGQPSGSMPFTAGTRTVRWPGLPPRMT